jgi:hypothetical protein
MYHMFVLLKWINFSDINFVKVALVYSMPNPCLRPSVCNDGPNDFYCMRLEVSSVAKSASLSVFL